MKIENATRKDLPRVVQLMRGLAEYEHLLDQFHVTEELLERYVFGPDAMTELFVGSIDGEVRGYAMIFHNFSSFHGRPGMYVEDIYVEPDARGRGLGKAMLMHIIRLARERGCPRCDWVVLDWNEPAQRFYESLGAKPLRDWRLYRMDAAAMDALLEGRQS